MKNVINLFNEKRNFRCFAKTPEERVEAFISHWYQQWNSAKKKMGGDLEFEFWEYDNIDFHLWGNLISEVDKAHFVEGKDSGSKSSFGSPASYNPTVEKITECDIHGNSADVYSEIYDKTHKSSHYHVYELKRNTAGDWLIYGIYFLVHPPKGLVIDPSKQAEILKMSDPNSNFIRGEDTDNLNENTLFQNDRTLILPHLFLKKGCTKLSTIGKLKVRSGVLGIVDFGSLIYDFEPLHRKVPPGEYSVETVTINDRVAGIRVRFSDHERPIKWYAANTPSGDWIYGVDYANLAIFDVENLFGLSRIEKERLFSEWTLSFQPQLLSMTDQNDCVITSSGFGDGAYPAFWGVNEKEKIVSLYIDFMILVHETEAGGYVSV